MDNHYLYLNTRAKSTELCFVREQMKVQDLKKNFTYGMAKRSIQNVCEIKGALQRRMFDESFGLVALMHLLMLVLANRFIQQS